MKYFIWNGDFVGNDLLFRAKNGYTCNIDLAQEYTEAEAFSLLKRLSSHEIAISSDFVRERSVPVLDAQDVAGMEEHTFDKFDPRQS